MSGIEFEDRTAEPAGTVTREVAAAAHVIVGTAIMASRGNASVGLEALAVALGQTTAETGASIDEIVEGVKKAYQSAMERLSELATSRSSDA
jgi:hypothetical protein